MCIFQFFATFLLCYVKIRGGNPGFEHWWMLEQYIVAGTAALFKIPWRGLTSKAIRVYSRSNGLIK